MMDESSPGATDMVATNTSPDLGHSRPNTQLRLLKTKQRWNLRNMQAFPMWKDELYDLLRIALPDQFVETPRPTVDSLTSYSELSHTRKTVKLKSSDLAALEAMTTAWDYYNGILFCIVKNSVELTESRIKHVHDNYGVASKGQEFLEYVTAQAQQESTDKQLDLKNGFAKLTITNQTTPDELENIMDFISVNYSKIKSWTQTTREMVEYTISLFPFDHNLKTYIDTFQAMYDAGFTEPFDTYDDFARAIINKHLSSVARPCVVCDTFVYYWGEDMY